MKHSSIKMNTPCEFINVTPVNPLISKCEIKVCYVGDKPNRNGSIITKEVAREHLAPSLGGSPIVGFWSESKQDFEEHNRVIDVSNGKFEIKDTTRPYGFVDLNARVWFQKFLDDGKDEHEYLMTEGYIWTGQYPEAQRIITEGNNQSMELDPNLIDAYWSESDNGNTQFFIINEAIISKLCILGEDCEPCFEGSTITAPTLQFSFDEGFKEKLFSMMNEMKNILEGGAPKMTVENEVLETEVEVVEEEIPAVEEEIVSEEPQVEVEEEVPVADPVPADEEDKKVKYILEEIPEYMELNTQYAELQTQFNALQESLAQKDEAIAELTQFKNKVERKEKENLINNFYMLSDEDKADVVANIDTYSLDDIEAKLSIICVRNKVSFDLEQDTIKQGPVTYSINSLQETEDDNDMPAWVRRAQEVAKTLI